MLRTLKTFKKYIEILLLSPQSLDTTGGRRGEGSWSKAAAAIIVNKNWDEEIILLDQITFVIYLLLITDTDKNDSWIKKCWSKSRIDLINIDLETYLLYNRVM